MDNIPTANKTVLGPDCRISGELSLDNDAVIMGQFQGTLRLAGKAKADVIAEDGVELLPGAQLEGQLYTSQLNVVEGATFQGDVCVGPKAIEVAIDALNLEAPEAAPQAAPKSAMPAPAAPAFEAGEEEVEYDDEPQVQTVPGSVNKILQRRRARVISSRNGAGTH